MRGAQVHVLPVSIVTWLAVAACAAPAASGHGSASAAEGSPATGSAGPDPAEEVAEDPGGTEAEPAETENGEDAGADQAPPTPCEGEGPHRAFDFWLGTWEVENPDGEVVGENRIERAQAGCAVMEHWRGKRGGTGTSINYIDPASGNWIQRWVSAQGAVVDLEGGPTDDGAMVLQGTMTRPDGQRMPMRGTWRQLEDGRVEQIFSLSKDGGETWEQAFRGLYTKVE